MQNIKSPIVVWAGLLFFGLPLMGELIVWSSTQFFGVNWAQSSTSLWAAPNAFNSVPVVILAVLYPFVRRVEHRTLSHLWLYAIIAGAIAIVSRLVVAPFELSGPVMFGWVSGISGATFIALLTVLVWFARKESATSFGHSLLFIGLVVAVQSPGTFIPLNLLYPSLESAPFTLVFVASAAVHVLVKGTAVWSLVNCAAVVSSTRGPLTVLSLLILLSGLQLGSLVVFSDSFQDRILLLINTLMGVGQWVIQYGIAVLIAYAVRIREPADGKSAPVNGPASPERA